MYTILGLNLLFLLVENRLSDFHCEVIMWAAKSRYRSELMYINLLSFMVLFSANKYLEL